MWIEYNPNPTGRKVEDCAIRAVAKAIDTDWESAYAEIVAAGFLMGDMPHSNSVIGAVLRKHGYSRYAIPDTCPDCYTAEDFAEDHPNGTYVLFFTRHVATLKDGAVYDSWDSTREVPQYYWHKED